MLNQRNQSDKTEPLQNQSNNNKNGKGSLVLLEKLLDAWRDINQVRMRHVGEQMVLDLVAQVTRQPACEQGRCRVGRVLARAIDPIGNGEVKIKLNSATECVCGHVCCNVFSPVTLIVGWYHRAMCVVHREY